MERKEQAKLKAEHKQELESKEAELKFKDTKLEQEKLSKKQLAELIEAERKAMLQENKELKEANQQTIYNADDYKRLRAIKEQQDITIQELNKQIEQIKQEAQEREENLRNVIQAKDQEIEDLKAENNEIKAQKYTLTQEQIQEIINQALAQKNAEIEQKNKELQAKNQQIETLKAENERWNELLETDPALKKAYYYALKTLEKISKQNEEDQENTQTPNNEELTENNGKQATYALNHIIKDDVSVFDKTEVPKQNQTHNEKKYFQLSDFIQIQDDVSELQAKNTDKTEISEQYQEEDQEQEQNNNKSKMKGF